jgi:lipopolysaccharide transport system ATP-binding protein
MQDVSNDQGRTVLFVSHNMGSVEALCSRALLLENGTVKYQDNKVTNVVSFYQDTNIKNNVFNPGEKHIRKGLLRINFINACTLDFTTKKHKSVFFTGEDVFFELEVENTLPTVEEIGLVVGIRRNDDYPIAMISSEYLGEKVTQEPGKKKYYFKIPNCPLSSGSYLVNLMIKMKGIQEDWIKDALGFEIEDRAFNYTYYKYPDTYKGFYLDYEFSSQQK